MTEDVRDKLARLGERCEEHLDALEQSIRMGRPELSRVEELRVLYREAGGVALEALDTLDERDALAARNAREKPRGVSGAANSPESPGG